MTQFPGYPAAGPAAGPPAAGPMAPPPPPEGRLRPRRVDPVPGTEYGLVHLEVAPVVSGLAVAALIAGVVSVLVSFAVGCLGAGGADSGWGGWVAGAFTLLSGSFGVAAVALGILGLRQVRRVASPPAVRFTGRGVAVAGISCGAVGLVITLLGLVLTMLLALV